MNNLFKNIFALFLITAIIFGFSPSYTLEETNTEKTFTDVISVENPIFNVTDKLSVGDKAPNFTAKGIKGKSIKLSSYKGKYVMINFWSSWCGPCINELPYIQNIAKKNKSVAVLGINTFDSYNTAKKFVLSSKYKYIKFASDFDEEIAKSYNIEAVPTSIFVDKKGIIRSIVVGGMSQSQFQKKINALKKFK